MAADFYKMDPAAWDFGTANLSLEEEAAYLRIVNAIHKHKGPVPNNDRVLSGLFRCSTRKARALLRALLDAGKVQIQGEFITNERAAEDLFRRGFISGSRAESGAKGGRTRAENAAKALKDKEADQANASSREEKSREEKEDTNVSSKKTASPKSKGTRLPENWRLPKSWGEWAVTDEGLPEADVRREGERFRDYWVGLSGARGVKRDWLATWRNWVRKNREDAKARAKPRSSGTPEIGEQRKLNDGRLLEYAGAVDGWMEVME